MSEQNNYLVLAYYHFSPVQDPAAEVITHKKFFRERDVTSRIYISEQGINGQMCAKESDAHEYMEWMHSRSQFEDLPFKVHSYHEHVFPRQTVKYRRQLVAFDKEIDLKTRGDHVSPEKWRTMMENDDGHILLDVRNDYEWQLGHFEGAELPPCESFRDFDSYAEKLKENKDPKTTPVLMYCTGGIRCELYSAVLKARGFQKVYQLEGGVIGYGLNQGSQHWLGKLFVFDDRLSVPISKEDTPVIGKCHHCKAPIENYYNCANMDCNKLFLCCHDCLQQFSGCCHDECRQAPRIRPYHHLDPHKPFRKWHHYFKEKLKKASE